MPWSASRPDAGYTPRRFDAPESAFCFSRVVGSVFIGGPSDPMTSGSNKDAALRTSAASPRQDRGHRTLRLIWRLSSGGAPNGSGWTRLGLTAERTCVFSILTLKSADPIRSTALKHWALKILQVMCWAIFLQDQDPGWQDGLSAGVAKRNGWPRAVPLQEREAGQSRAERSTTSRPSRPG
jgi:hypothetical protein